MKIRKSTLAIFGLVLISFILSIYFYPQVPEQVATHWDFQGEVNGYMSKFWGLFVMPVLITGIAALFLVIPRIDPKKENIEKFRKYYDGFVIILLLFILLSIGAAILVSKNVKNIFLRNLLLLGFLAIASGAVWLIWMAAKSGEM